MRSLEQTVEQRLLASVFRRKGIIHTIEEPGATRPSGRRASKPCHADREVVRGAADEAIVAIGRGMDESRLDELSDSRRK